MKKAWLVYTCYLLFVYVWYWELNPGLYVCWASALLLSCIYILNSVIFRRWSVIIMSLRPVWAPLWDAGFFVCLFFKITLKSSQGITWCSTRLRASAIWRMFFDSWEIQNLRPAWSIASIWTPVPSACEALCVWALPFKAWMSLSRLPAFLHLWPCSQNELWICRHPAPQSQFWNYRNSENKFFHRFLPSDLSLCEAA